MTKGYAITRLQDAAHRYRLGIVKELGLQIGIGLCKAHKMSDAEIAKIAMMQTKEIAEIMRSTRYERLREDFIHGNYMRVYNGKR